MSSVRQNAPDGRFEVLSPEGVQFTRELRQAPPVPTLSGRRIAFLWDLLFKGDFVFDALAQQLSETHDRLTFVGHEAFGDIHGGDEQQVLADLPELFVQHRIDAVVVGVGA